MKSRHEVDLTEGSMAGKILLYATPLAATGILQQLFNAADVAVVGQFVGKNAMAAVGANAAIINLIVNLFIGISLGTNVIIATSIGRNDKKTVQQTAHTSILLALIGGFAVLVLGEIVASPLISSLSVPDEVLPMALLYLRVYLAGMPVILLYNFEAAIYRGIGDTRTPLLALCISGMINVALNLLFVMAFHMAVEGVALATIISNLISSVILFFKLHIGSDKVKIDFSELRITAPILRRILVIGVPSGIQSAIFSVANIVIQTAINSLGATIMAASSAAFNIEIFVWYVINSFAQTCTTFVGQNFGAGKIDRCRKALFACLIIDAIVPQHS